MTENADVASRGGSVRDKDRGPQRDKRGQLGLPFHPLIKSSMGGEKGSRISKSPFCLQSLTQRRGQGKMCAFIFLNPPADFPPIFKLLFQQISPAPLQEKKEGDSSVVIFPLVDVFTHIYVLRTQGCRLVKWQRNWLNNLSFCLSRHFKHDI